MTMDVGDLTFPQAMEAVINGGTITKREWDDPDTYCLMKNNRLMLHKSSGTEHDWIINDGDLHGRDWHVLSGPATH